MVRFMKRTVLITGGSRGIGAAAVREFSEKNYAAAFFYRESEAAAEKISSETGAAAIKCDVSDPSQVKEGVAQAKASLGVTDFDVLICSAGISLWGLLTDMTDSQWEKLWRINVGGCVYTAREVLPAMISRKKGSIIMVSSIWGQTGASCEAAYSATKAAIIGFTKALAKEAGPSGVRVNCVSPGIIDTDMNSEYSEQDIKSLAEETALGRTGTPEEIAKAIYFLSSDEASYITGQVLGANGGFIL